jgi:hypothetical protein
MAYNTEELYKMALKIIKEKKLRTIEDLISYMPCDRSTWYNHFGKKLDKSDTIKKELEQNKVIKKELEQNKVAFKERLVNMWTSLTHTSPATQIFLYKLCANKEEKEAIYDTSIKASIEPPKHEITLNLIKDDEKKLIEEKKESEE